MGLCHQCLYIGRHVSDCDEHGEKKENPKAVSKAATKKEK